VPGVPDQVPGRGIHVPHVGTRPGGVDPGPLGGRDQVIDLPLPPGGLAQRHRAGHVRVVAAVHRAEVHRDQVTATQRPVGGRMVRDGAVRAAGDDGVEGRTGRAERDHPPVQRGGQGAFGQAGADQAEGVGQRLVTDPAGGRQQFELGRVLDDAEFLDDVPEGDERHRGRRRGQVRLPLHRHLLRLVADGPPAPGDGLGRQPRFDEPLGDQFQVRAVPLGRQRVPGIGGQHGAAGRGDQHCRVGTGQAGEVEDVLPRRNETGISTGLSDFRLRPPPAGLVNLRHVLHATRDRNPRPAGG
jgi:hypothetical protein